MKQSATKLDTLKTHLREFSRQELDESSAFERDELIDAATGTRVQKMPVAGKRVWHMFIITVFRHHKTPGRRLHSFTALLIRLYAYGSKISNNSGLVQRAAATYVHVIAIPMHVSIRCLFLRPLISLLSRELCNDVQSVSRFSEARVARRNENPCRRSGKFRAQAG